MKLLRHPDQWNRGAIGLSLDDVADGLLFVMDKTSRWPLTMEGVKFSIDAYWLSESGMVLEHAELFPGMPVSWPDCFAKYVLELPMQKAPRYKVGDFVEVPDDPRANS